LHQQYHKVQQVSARLKTLVLPGPQSQTLLPLLKEGPGGWPAVQHGDGDATLAWRGVENAEDFTPAGALLSVLQFVAGAGRALHTCHIRPYYY